MVAIGTGNGWVSISYDDKRVGYIFRDGNPTFTKNGQHPHIEFDATMLDVVIAGFERLKKELASK